MTNHDIPEAAVDAARQVLYDQYYAGTVTNGRIRAALEAAATHLQAAAFDEGVQAAMSSWNAYAKRQCTPSNPYRTRARRLRGVGRRTRDPRR